MDQQERHALARKRILSILEKHVAANARTLEQKISDAGPNNQRIDPHILTPARKSLEKEGTVAREVTGNNHWYYLANTPQFRIQARIKEQQAILTQFRKKDLVLRVGQTLEIATYRALSATDYEFYGRYKDLDAHDDSKLYSKEEPPQHVGRRALSGDENLDFLVRHPEAGQLALECKNVREWLYPDRAEIMELSRKATALNAVPVLIARRIPFVTFKLLNACGFIVHQTYNQLLPASEAAVAAKMRDKKLLGYHDIRTGNQPDKRLLKFITENMGKAAPEAREKFDEFQDLIAAFGSEEMDYNEFAARVRRRVNGTNEDNDWPEPEE